MDVHYQVKQIEYALNTYQLVSVTFHICYLCHYQNVLFGQIPYYMTFSRHVNFANFAMPKKIAKFS